MKQILIFIVLFIMGCSAVRGQQYAGLNGLIHIPTADMDSAGDARLGSHFLNPHLTPDKGFIYNGKKYHTFDFYLSLTPFEWVEVGYTMTLFKAKNSQGKGRYKSKDRYFSIKFRPLKEGKWWPAVAIGANDFLGTNFKFRHETEGGNDFFRNIFLALTKHFDASGHDFGVTVDYRWYTARYNRRFNGLVAGVTYRPAFYRPLRFMAEFNGSQVSVGADCLLFKHFLLQASLTNGKYPQGGICYMINLF